MKWMRWVLGIAVPSVLVTGCSFSFNALGASSGDPSTPTVGANGIASAAPAFYVEPKLTHGQTTLPQAGYLAPNVVLTSTAGQTVNLYSLLAKGKPVFINFFATWCPPCRAEMPDLVKGAKQFGRDVTFLGINPTPSEASPSNVSAFIKKYGVPYPVLLDTTGAVTQGWFVSGIPTSFLIAPNGVILAVNPGPTMNVKQFLQKAYVGGKIST